jgi:hypothetical protein
MNNWHDDDWTLTPEDGETLPERTWEPLLAPVPLDAPDAAWLLAREDAEEEAALQHMLEEAEAFWSERRRS